MPKPCPDEEILIDFLEDRLTDRQRSRIENHLAGCGACRDLVATWVALIQGDALSDAAPVPSAVTRNAVNAVAGLAKASMPKRALERIRRLVSQGKAMMEPLALGSGPQPVTVRGGQAAVSDHVIRRRKAFGDLDLRIEIERCGPGQASIRVACAGRPSPAAPVRVALCKAEREVASMLLGETPVLFEEIPYGSYALVLMRNRVQLGEYLFELTDAP